jgi:phospholipid/cholesterol/gamma-HCH transport system ATP-binding protein
MNVENRQSESPLARLVDVHKAFGDNHVLRGVSLTLPEHRCTFVVGPSGTGKSVLVRHLVGLLLPDSGEVYYRGQRVDELPEEELFELRKQCVYVFQHPTLFDSMSVLKNVSLVIKYHLGLKSREAEARAALELERLGMAHLGPQSPLQLAAGDQKMVSLARALSLQPETLILDEPTTGLDPYAAHELDRHTARLRERGVSLIVISHDLRSIRRLADDVVFLFRGGVRFHGTADDFFSSTDHVVRQFVTGSTDGEI